MCAPPDCAERLAEVGVPLVPFGQPVRSLVHGTTPPSAADVPRRAAALRTALSPEICARAAAVAVTIRTDGATVAATALLDAARRTVATWS